MSRQISKRKPVIFVGWLKDAEESTIPIMKEFGFTGPMIPGLGHVSHVHATKEVMERAIEKWAGFNYMSFTGLDENDVQTEEQPYWKERK